jgi:CrcB protein
MWAFFIRKENIVIKTRLYTQYDTHPELPINPDVVKEGEYKWPPHFRPILILYVFIGGCFGALARYGAIENLPTLANGWPLAMTFVNLLGAFALGLLLESLSRLGEDKGALRAARLVLGTGFIGAFTTYSTFVVDTHSLIVTGNTTTAVWYIVSTLIGGLTVCGLGIQLAATYHQRGQNR